MTQETKDICVMIGSFYVTPGPHVIIRSRLKDHLRTVLSYAEDRQAGFTLDGVVLCVGGGCFGFIQVWKL